MIVKAWRDETGPHRVVLPEGETDVSRGIPQGEPWELMIDDITAEQIAQALRENGIWTKHDLRRFVKDARAALFSLVGAKLAALLKQTREVQ